MRIPPLSVCLLACTLAGGLPAVAEEHAPDPATGRRDTLVRAALGTAWAPAPRALAAPAARSLHLQQSPRTSGSAGPSIGSVGLGAVAGLSDVEIGPSFRYWINDRVGVQAHLGFSGDDFFNEDIEYLRFEPTVIVALGDFGRDAVNVRPYVGAGLRVLRTDIGDFNDLDAKPAAVGGVEFGFRAAPRLKASAEVSLAAQNEFEDDLFRGPDLGGGRLVALLHYFFD